MDQRSRHIFEINIKDLLFVILRKTGIICLAGIVAAGVFLGYKMISGANDADVLDASVRLENEGDIDYEERVHNIDRAKDLINSIDALNDQLENQRKYVTDSVLMRIDPENETVTTAQLIVTPSDSTTTGIDRALVTFYTQDILAGEYLSDFADELDTNQGYLIELIKVENDASSYSVSLSGDSRIVGTINIKVIGPSADYSDRIMDLIVDEVNSKHADLNDTMAAHEVAFVGRQCSNIVDNSTRDLQVSAVNRFETLQKQIATFDESIGEIASKIGLKNKASVYNYFSSVKEGQEVPTARTFVKLAAIGFVIGSFLTVLAITFIYIWGRKFTTQARFFCKYPQIKQIGVAKPNANRSALVKLIDQKTENDSKLSKEDNNKYIAANLKNMTYGMNKVLITGTAETDKVKDLVKLMNVKADVKGSFFNDPECLESVPEYDGIILVEQRNYSDFRQIRKEIELISNTDTKLIGAIII